MPATYTHRYTYEQISGRGRKTWETVQVKQPERKIFGIDVGYSTFQKYNHQNYVLGHTYVDLVSIERWATDSELAAHNPERAAEAKQLMKSIIKEITGKEDDTVKEPKTAADFITALQEIYNESRSAYSTAQGKVDVEQAALFAAEEAVRNASHKDPILDARLTVARGELTLAEDERRKEYTHLLDVHDQKVKALREQFAAFLDEHYAASPEKLDTATMQLLEAGICKPAELARLAERHANNPTMLRIIGSHARKLRESGKLTYHESLDATRAIGAANAANDGSRELKIFDSATSACAYGLDKSPTHAARMDKYVVGWFDTFREQMNNLPNTPEYDEAE